MQAYDCCIGIGKSGLLWPSVACSSETMDSARRIDGANCPEKYVGPKSNCPGKYVAQRAASYRPNWLVT